MKFNTIIITLLLLALTSCVDKNSTNKETVIYPEGFFSVDSELYFSDGKAFYCTFKDWKHLYELRGTEEKPKSPIIVQETLPSDMRFIRFCNTGIVTPLFYK